MLLNSLGLHPYGTLRDTSIDLGDGLSVIYGLNEAGKSTLLSAYADLLCGIPRRTPRAALAGGRAKLRINASITLSDSSTVGVTRTSKNYPHDLTDTVTGEPVEPKVRAALTGVGDHSMLAARFGLDHDRLTRGGTALMDGGGTLADIVFEARTGTDLRALVNTLTTRIDSLYTPRANSASDLMKADNLRKDKADDLAGAMATAEVVEAAKKRKEYADAELKQSRQRVAHLRDRHQRLKGLADAWRYWEQYRARRDELARIVQSGPCLPADRLQEVIDTFERQREIDEELHQQRGSAEEAKRERAGLNVDERLLACQPAVDTLNAQCHAMEAARLVVDELGRTAMSIRNDLRKLLARLGVRADGEPAIALVSVAVPDDRAADLDRLADHGDRLHEELDKTRAGLHEAAAAVEAAERAAAAAAQDERPDSGNLPRLDDTRDARNLLWLTIRGSWLCGEPIPHPIASGPKDLADRYEAAVAQADSTADDAATEAGELCEVERNRISATAAARATVEERRRALATAEDRVEEAERRHQRWQKDWDGCTAAAGLPRSIGIAGWRERSGLLQEAGGWAEKLAESEQQQAEAAQTVADWQEAASTLADQLGQTIPVEQLPAWFGGIRSAYEESKSNRKTAKVHKQTEEKTAERINQLQAERTGLDALLDKVAAENGVDRTALDGLIARSQNLRSATQELAAQEENLRATHPGATLDELVAQFTARDPDQLEADVYSAKDAFEEAEEATGVAQEQALAANSELVELAGRSGADALAQELSRQTGEVLDIIEEYAVNRIMHHLLTSELQAYVESHQNPVLERAGAYLAQLTGGRYTGLRADGEDAQRSLIVTGADDADYLTGELSEGTATQVYLALSLAGVLEVQREREEAGQERLPIMLDDVLMTFDDQRAESALRLLTEIGRQQQIILFTHHASVREQASAVSGAIAVVNLSAPAAIG